MNVLEICQEAADMTATQRPENLFEKNVQHNAIFLAVIKNELDSLMRYGNWQELLGEAEFDLIKGKSFYPFDEIVPDFYALIHNTVFIKDGMEKINGAITSEEKMNEKYFYCTDFDCSFKIENNGFRFLKLAQKNAKVVFMYRSNAVCMDAKTYERKNVVTQNSDVPLFDAYLVKLGVIWRLLKRNGMDYEEEYNEYQKELKKKFGLTLGMKDIKLFNAWPENCHCAPINVCVKNNK